MDAMKNRMKEMHIDKDHIDRTSSVSNDDLAKGRYLSHTSAEAADRPKSPIPQRKPPSSPTFRMTLGQKADPCEGLFYDLIVYNWRLFFEIQ